MFHRIREIVSLEDLKITVIFVDGIKKEYDIRQMMELFPQMEALRNEMLFKSAKLEPCGYGICWNDELDIDAEEIWDDGIEIGKVEVDLYAEIGNNLAKARSENEMTQRELAKKTGINQADISKIERGVANPSLNTLKRLASGMGLQVKIKFIPIQE